MPARRTLLHLPIRHRPGHSNPLLLFAVISLVALVLLGVLLFRGGRRPASISGDEPQSMVMFCAAGIRPPIERISAEYKRRFGVDIEVTWGGSNTLLSQLEVAQTGDIYLAADDSYIELGRKKGLVAEAIPLAEMRPVIAVAEGNPKGIETIDDLLAEGIRVAMGNPDQAAVGKKARGLLQKSGHWDALEKQVTTSGVFLPTVPEVANAVKLGSADAGIIWDAVAAQHPELIEVRTPELDLGTSQITISILSRCQSPAAALKFARFAAARDEGLQEFTKLGYNAADGDIWTPVPELTFFAGSVNRRALEPIIHQFEEREGVVINTVYDGCGILTGRMEAMLGQDQSNGFPDMYMACDVYYLETVKEHFQDAANVSNTDIVIVTKKDNPLDIRGLDDLLRPDVRLVLGEPKQCTIGVLSKRLLEDAKVYSKLVSTKDIPRKASSALLVPDVLLDAADAVLAYRTDTLAQRDKLEVITIDSALAKAVQPYSISRSSDFKELSRRLFDAIASSQQHFESLGFSWQLKAAPPIATGGSGD